MAGRQRRGRGGVIAKAISDRSGVRYPMSEMVIEQGTGWLIHYSEDDGMWNLVDHPQLHVQQFVEYGDPFPVEQARPEQEFINVLALSDGIGQILLVGGDGQGNYLETE